jgi:hypothetical protein
VSEETCGFRYSTSTLVLSRTRVRLADLMMLRPREQVHGNWRCQTIGKVG